jgi:nucleotide-binding universal stress UspA family protein
VLTVPQRGPDAVPVGPAPFARILCAVDFSDCSLAALRHAVAVASQAGAHLDVLSVVQLIPMYETTGAVPLYYPGLLDDLKADIAKRLEAVVASAVTGVAVDQFVTVGSPYREIVRMAGERKTDLVVLGAYSHGTIDHMFFGSTSNHVVRQAPCPVLTIRN